MYLQRTPRAGNAHVTMGFQPTVSSQPAGPHLAQSMNASKVNAVRYAAWRRHLVERR